MPILFLPKPHKTLQKINPQDSIEIVELIKELEENEELGTRLKYELNEFFSLHHKKYRIIYTIKNGDILIVYIGLRKKAYDEVKKLLKRIFDQIKSEDSE